MWYAYGVPYKDKEMHKQYRIKRSADNLQFLRDLKSEKGCIDCGWNEHHAGLEFDHREDKHLNVTAMTCHSKQKLLAEIDKCDIVCGTCHNMRTWNRKHGE